MADVQTELGCEEFGHRLLKVEDNRDPEHARQPGCEDEGVRQRVHLDEGIASAHLEHARPDCGQQHEPGVLGDVQEWSSTIWRLPALPGRGGPFLYIAQYAWFM